MHLRNRRRCRRFATALLRFIIGTGLFFCPTAVLFGQTDVPDELPARSDDFLYAKALLRTGFPKLAIGLFGREEAKPGQTPLRKREIGELIVAAYQQLASKAPDADARARYLARAKKKIDTMAAELGDKAVTPALNYQRAKVLQTQGRNIARAIGQERNPQRKKELIAEGVRKFDDCAAILDSTAKTVATRVQQARDRNPAGYLREVGDIRVVGIQSELQRCWTAYYKALLYPEGSADYETNLAQAVQFFGAFVEKYPNDMGMLIARYGRGLSYKLRKKWDEAKKDFGQVVSAIDAEEEARERKIPEVHPIKARCRINWAEMSSRLGEHDEALAGLKRMFETNEVLTRDMSIRDLALVTKAEVLAGKAGALNDADKRDEARQTYKDAIALLGEVMQRGGPQSYKAKELTAKYVREGNLALLSADARMALIESMLRAKKYDEAIPQLRKLAYETNVKKASPKLRFRAHRMLAVALRYAGDYPKSINEFEAVWTGYRREAGKTITKEELAKIGLELTWTLSVHSGKHPGDPTLRKRYRDSLKRLADELPETKEGRDARLYHAEALREDARTPDEFVKAAEAYVLVKPDSKHFGRAYYLQGLCYFNAYKQYDSMGIQDDPKARAVLKKALQILLDAIGKGLESPAAPAGESWLIEAAGVLSDLYLETGQSDKALEILKRVSAKFPAKSVDDPKMLTTWVSVYLRTGQLPKALAALDELADRKKTVKVENLFNSTMEVADGYFQQTEKLRKEAKDALSAAADIKPDAEAAEKARKTRLEAEAKTKLADAARLGKATSDLLKRALPLVEQAAEDRIRVATFIANRSFAAGGYQTAIEAVELVQKWYAEDKRKDDDRLWGLKLVKVKSYEAMNYWPREAKDLLAKIESDEQHGGFLEIKKLRASVLEQENNWEESLKIWDELGSGLAVGTPDWFESRFRKAKAMYKLGRTAEADKLINSLEALHPDLGDRVVPGVRARFLKLRKLKGDYKD